MRQQPTSSAAFGILVGLLAWPACAALESGVYRVLPGTTVEERGDRVPNQSRVVPFSATVTFDLGTVPPSLTAVITNAVLEGGAPFALTVRSSFGIRLVDGTYRFSGDYLRDIQASGTQYYFDWRFSTSTNGQVVWSGITGWAGGHIWLVTISDITIVPDPRLDITQAGSQVTISWPATDTGYRLEQAGNLPAPDWSTITNTVAMVGERFSVTVGAGTAQGFFRLRKF